MGLKSGSIFGMSENFHHTKVIIGKQYDKILIYVLGSLLTDPNPKKGTRKLSTSSQNAPLGGKTIEPNKYCTHPFFEGENMVNQQNTFASQKNVPPRDQFSYSRPNISGGLPTCHWPGAQIQPPMPKRLSQGEGSKLRGKI